MAFPPEFRKRHPNIEYFSHPEWTELLPIANRLVQRKLTDPNDYDIDYEETLRTALHKMRLSKVDTHWDLDPRFNADIRISFYNRPMLPQSKSTPTKGRFSADPDSLTRARFNELFIATDISVNTLVYVLDRFTLDQIGAITDWIEANDKDIKSVCSAKSLKRIMNFIQYTVNRLNEDITLAHRRIADLCRQVVEEKNVSFTEFKARSEGIIGSFERPHYLPQGVAYCITDGCKCDTSV